MPRDTEQDLLTERLRLRRPAAGDLSAVDRIHRTPAAIAHNPSDALAGPEAAQDLLRRWQDRWRSDGVGYWAVTERANPAVLGVCGVKPVRLSGAPVLNLFYRFDPAAWGRGFGTEAAIAVVGWVARIRPEQKLIARIRPDNTASARVAANAGLVRAPELDAEGEDGPDHIWIYPDPPRQ